MLKEVSLDKWPQHSINKSLNESKPKLPGKQTTSGLWHGWCRALPRSPSSCRAKAPISLAAGAVGSWYLSVEFFSETCLLVRDFSEEPFQFQPFLCLPPRLLLGLYCSSTPLSAQCSLSSSYRKSPAQRLFPRERLRLFVWFHLCTQKHGQ